MKKSVGTDDCNSFENGHDPKRRRMLFGIPAFLALLISIPPIFAKHVFAMGSRAYPQGMRKIRGDVRINGIPAKIGDTVKPGDTVATGKDAEAVFVADKSVCMLRENTRIEIAEEKRENAVTSVIRLIRGKIMSVSRKKRERIVTTTAILGVRGTGVYVEAEPDITYVCLCYGTADIIAAASGETDSFTTWYHEKPRYVRAAGAEKMIEPAPVKNHTDAELIMLESMVGRQPPFLDNEDGNGGY